MADFRGFNTGSSVAMSLKNDGAFMLDAKLVSGSINQALTLPSGARFDGMPIFIIEKNSWYSFSGGVEDSDFKPINGGSASNISFEEFDKTKVYTVGDYAIYNKNLYECITTTTIDTDFVDTEWKLLIGSIEDTFVKIKEEFDKTNQYQVEDIVIYNKKVYKNVTPNTVGEEFNLNEWDLLIGGGDGGSSTITEDIEVYGVCDQLGYKDGDTIPNGTDITTILKTLLQKVVHPTYVAPTLTVKTDKTLVEIGVETTIVVTPTFTQNNGGAINGYKLYRNDVLLEEETVLGSYTDTYTPTSVFNYKYEVSYDDGEILQNNTGEDDETGRILAGTIEKTSGNISVTSPSYYGTLADIPTADNVIGLTKSIRTKGNFTNTFVLNNEYAVFCYPASFGSLTGIFDSNNFDYIDTFTVLDLVINTVDYKCYYGLKQLDTEGFQYIFKY